MSKKNSKVSIGGDNESPGDVEKRSGIDGAVLVTGAAGAVGSFVVKTLLERGVSVIAVDKPGANYPKAPKGELFKVRSGDLRDPSFCEEVVEGASYIIHAAALLDVSESCEELFATNVGVTKNLYEVARRSNVKLFVYLSSGGIYDFESQNKAGGKLRRFFGIGKSKVDASKKSSRPTEIGKQEGGRKRAVKGKGGCTEWTPFAAPSTHYHASKIEAEEVIRELAEARGPALTVLRPALVYGPGGRGYSAMGSLVCIPPLLYLLSGGHMVGFVGGPRISWVHSEDVARAALFVLDNRNAWGETYNLADDTPLSLGESATVAVKSYGLPIEFVLPILPRWFLQRLEPLFSSHIVSEIIDYIAGKIWRFICLRHGCTDDLKPHITQTLLFYSLRHTKVSNEKLCSVGFNYKWPDLRSGYPDVLAWYMDRNWTPTGEQLLATRDVEVSFRLGWKGTCSYSGKQGGPYKSSIDIQVSIPRILRLSTKWTASVLGSCFFETLADNVSCRGSLEIRLLEKRLLLYLDLRDNDHNPIHIRASTKLEMGSIFRRKRASLGNADGISPDGTSPDGIPPDDGNNRFPIAFFESLTTLNATGYDSQGREIMRSKLKADLPSELLKFITSLRIKY